MRVNGSYSPYELNNSGIINSKPKTEKEYASYLMKKYPCLSPGKNSSVSVTSGLLKKALSNEKTGKLLEKELSKAPDYIKQAQQSAIAHGATLKFCAIEFGEEYSTMITCTVTDGGGTDPDIDEWLDRIKERKEKQKEETKKLKHKQEELAQYKMEFKGKDLEDLTTQFAMNLATQSSLISGGKFDMKG